jgi:hypothetical protein
MSSCRAEERSSVLAIPAVPSCHAENGGELHGLPLANVAPHRPSLIQHALWFRNPVRKKLVEPMRGSQTLLVLAATIAAATARADFVIASTPLTSGPISETISDNPPDEASTRSKLASEFGNQISCGPPDRAFRRQSDLRTRRGAPFLVCAARRSRAVRSWASRSRREISSASRN